MPALKVFSVYDQKVEAFMQPFFCITIAQAIRMFTDSCNEPTSMFNKHPEDYALFELGVFDDGGGQLISNATAKHLVTALEVVERPDANPHGTGKLSQIR